MNIFKSFSKSIQKSAGGWMQVFSQGEERRDYYKGIVFSAIDAIASNVSAVPFYLYESNSNEDKNKINNAHPAIKILKNPNPFLTEKMLFYVTSAHIDVYGSAYWYINKAIDKKTISEIWTLDPARMSIVLNKEGYGIDSYKYTSGDKNISFNIDEIIHIKRPNPYSVYEGLSALQMARYEIEGDLSAIDWNRALFENGVMPSGVLTTENSLTKDSLNSLKEQLNDRHAGKRNAYKLMLLDSGLKWQQTALNQKDMDFIEQRRFSRDQILAILKVPKTIVAITEDVNRANAEASDYVFAKRTVKPRLDIICDALNSSFLPKFKNTQPVLFAYDDPTPRDEALELSRYTQAVGKWMTPNEIRAEQGLEPKEGGDSLNLVDLSSLTSLVTPDVPTTPEPDKDNKGIVKKEIVQPYEQQLLKDKQSYLKVQELKYRIALMAHFKFLVRDIRKSISSTTFKKKDLAHFKGNSIPEIYSDVVGSLESWKNTLVGINLKYLIETGEKAVEQNKNIYGFNFNLQNSGAYNFLSKKATDSASQVTSTIDQRIRDAIANNLLNDVTSVSKIKNDVASLLKEEAEWRVERIVRNELNNAYSYASYEVYQANDIVEKLKWITADDERTCPICQKSDQQVVTKNKQFSNGFDYPPAHVSCRCDVVPYFGDEEMRDFSNTRRSYEAFDWTNIEGESSNVKRNNAIANVWKQNFPEYPEFTKNFKWNIEPVNINELSLYTRGEKYKVETYIQDMKKGAKFPPVMLVKLPGEEKGPLELLDGNHRVEALRRLGAKMVYVLVGRPIL